MKVIKEYSSEEVIEGLQKKDKEVFRFLFEKYFGQLVHFAEYFLLEREAAENVVQDCFLKLWEKTDFSNIRNFNSYLFILWFNRERRSSINYSSISCGEKGCYNQKNLYMHSNKYNNGRTCLFP